MTVSITHTKNESPVLSLSYRIAAGPGNPNLELYAHFDPQAYMPSSDRNPEACRALAADHLRGCVALLELLNGSETKLSVSATFNAGQLPPVERHRIVSHLSAVRTYLDDVVQRGSGTFIQHPDPLCMFTLASIPRTDITWLEAKLTLQAKGTDLPPFFIHPHTNGNPMSLQTLTTFAASCEQAWTMSVGASCKVAAQLNEDGSYSVVMVNMEAASFTASEKPAWYTIRPVTNRDLNLSNVPVWPYESGVPFPPSPPLLQSFAETDAEVWASECANAIDKFLEPANIAWASQLDAEIAERISVHRDTLASALAKRVVPLSANGSPASAGMCKMVETQLQRNLSQAFECPVICVHTARPTRASDASFAVYLQAESTDNEGTVSSTADAVMDARESMLMYSTGLRNTAAMNESSPSVRLQPMGVRLHSRKVHRFVTPDVQPVSLRTTVAVPLRNVPQWPILQNEAVYPAPAEFKDLPTWTWQLQYNAPTAAQDEMLVEITINGSEDREVRMTSKGDAWASALAAFNFAYPGIAEDLDRFRGKEGHEAEARNAVAAFEFICALVAKSADVAEAHKLNNKPTETRGYTVRESAFKEHEKWPFPKGALMMTISLPGTPAHHPLPEIAGCTAIEAPDRGTWFFQTAKGAYLSFEERLVNPERKLVVNNLNVLLHRSVRGSAIVQRNARLPYIDAVNPALIYRTRSVQTQQVESFASGTRDWNMAAMNEQNDQPAPLKKHLQNLFTDLFAAWTPGADHPKAAVNMEVKFRVPLNPHERDPFYSEIPVTLVSNIPLSIPGDWSGQGENFVSRLEATIADWSRQMNPPQEGQFSFSLQILLNDRAQIALTGILPARLALTPSR